jgi:hypothetical protein
MTENPNKAELDAQLSAMPKMVFSINGKEYDALLALAKVSLNTLYELKTKTGIGMQTLMKMVSKMGDFKDPTELLEDKDAFNAFRIIIWLARTHAGEKLSISEANDFPITDLLLVGDPALEDTAPKATPPASDQAGSEAAATGGTT